MNIVQEFSRFAKQYDNHNIIQSQVAKRLVSMIDYKSYTHILDIGCGSGSIYKNIIKTDISFEQFIGADLSLEMLNLHPNSSKIKKISFDFNNIKNFEQIKTFDYDVVVSSSALQWSKDLNFTLKEISKLSTQFYFAFFTANTFSTLHKTTKLQSPIYTKEFIQDSLNRYYNSSLEIINYQLYFNSVYEIFQYIKQSGVSGGKKRLSYKEIKQVIKNYPLNYLEFEVLFIKATKK